MSERIEKHKTRLAEARQYLLEVFDQVGDRWEDQLFADGAQWTIRQLGIHLVLADKGHNGMLMMGAKGENLIPEDYDLERYNRSAPRKQDLSPDDIRAKLHQSRSELLSWLDTIDDATLDMETRHANLQILSLSKILNIMAGHERLHADDIRKYLGEEAQSS